MIKLMRRVVAVWVVVLIVVGLVVWQSRQGQNNQGKQEYPCLIAFDTDTNARTGFPRIAPDPIPQSIFDITTGRAMNRLRGYDPRPVLARATAYYLTTSTTGFFGQPINLYWSSPTSEVEKLLITGASGKLDDLTYRATDKWIAVGWREAERAADDSRNMLSLFDAAGTLQRQIVLPFTGILQRAYDDYFVYEGKTDYYLVSLPDLTVQSVPKLIDRATAWYWSAKRDKVMLFAPSAIAVIWLDAKQSAVWQFPPNRMFPLSNEGKPVGFWSWSPDGRYVTAQFLDRQGGLRTQQLALYLFDTLRKETFEQYTDPLLTSKMQGGLVVDGKQAQWMADGRLFYYLPYWSEAAILAGDGEPSRNGTAQPSTQLKNHLWALIQIDPATRQRTIISKDIQWLPERYHYERLGTRLVWVPEPNASEAEAKTLWYWVGPDPRERKLIFAEEGVLETSPRVGGGKELVVFEWSVHKLGQPQFVSFVIVNIKTGDHWILPRDIVDESVTFTPDEHYVQYVVKGQAGDYAAQRLDLVTGKTESWPMPSNERMVWTADNRAIFYLTETGAGHTAERLDLATGQRQQLIGGKQNMVMLADESQAILIAWRDDSGQQRVERFLADGKRVGDFPVTGDIRERISTAISPDGQAGVFFFSDGVTDLFELAQTGKAAPIDISARLGGAMWNMIWAPDGQNVAIAMLDAQQAGHILILSKEGKLLHTWPISPPQVGVIPNYKWSSCRIAPSFSSEVGGG